MFEILRSVVSHYHYIFCHMVIHFVFLFSIFHNCICVSWDGKRISYLLVSQKGMDSFKLKTAKYCSYQMYSNAYLPNQTGYIND
jgi:hypothetical protein